MNDKELLEKIKDNIFHLGYSMQDAPYHGVSNETIKGVNYAIDKILDGTDITIQEIIEEKRKASK
ncbi:hypothetical protein [Gracilibacillus thailandensis]|uniref:Uncharacterized protein n=1 Tax=Gracilibacillus thailandensis TaxID=563735 RepID=A0A6N7QWQ0_9BACI|nr:hypothetical protein [Gracilibacillus thailandensis]MRI65150.1 hypothetical protein [Gracilibacillus thailandensis]